MMCEGQRKTLLYIERVVVEVTRMILATPTMAGIASILIAVYLSNLIYSRVTSHTLLSLI